MRSTLTFEEALQLLTDIEQSRIYFERLYRWSIDSGFPQEHPLTQSLRSSIADLRNLCLTINSDCRKGSLCRYEKRARDWPRL